VRRRPPFLRPGPALAAIASLLVLVLLTFGLLSKATNRTIDSNLAEGKPTPAPGFQLPALIADEPVVAKRFELPKLRTGPPPLPPLARPLRAALADGQINIAELRGVPVVLNFWASWCVPCREEAPILERGWRRDSRRGVLYLGLNMQDLTDDARGFLKEFGITYPTIRDPGDSVAKDYGATGIPETYFMDRRGRVVGHVIGVLTDKLLATGVSAARSGQVVGTEQGGARRSQR
jgi:cytochrome c biogenesis protein CcmG, thiol:disulfide interchange protein DsbE